MKPETKREILLAIFVGLLIAMNLLGGKITSLFGISVSVGIFIVPLTFLITDIIGEVDGKKTARKFVLIGGFVLLLIFGFTAFCVILEPHERYIYNDEYILIFGNSLRMIIASLVAFTISQLHDIWAFHFWKKITNGHFLWLRNNFSTLISQAIDTLLFMMIAFYAITPKFTIPFIITLSIPYYLFKVGFTALDTPLVYLGVHWLKKK